MKNYVSEALSTKNQNRLEGLDSEGLGLKKLDGATINLDHALALLAVSHCGRSFLTNTSQTKPKT